MEDLFRSRYTSFVKFKIVFDPSSQPLETGVVKKIAFVELPTFADQNKVLKWHDLYYRGSRRVVIEMADFEDFKSCMAFNQQHEQQLRDVEREFLAGRNRHGWAEDHGRGMVGHDNMSGGHGNQFLGYGRGILGDNASHLHRGEQIHSRPANTGFQSTPQPPALLQHPRNTSVSDHPKPNPFGNAKPVDILLKEREFEKHVITINHTTIKTAGVMETPSEANGVQPPVKSEPVKKEPVRSESVKNVPSPQEPSLPKKPGFAPAPIPSSVYGQKQSLADILSKNDSDLAVSPKPTRKSATATPKPQVAKPTILKKKPAVTASHNEKEDENPEPEKEVAATKVESGDSVAELSVETKQPVNEIEAGSVVGETPVPILAAAKESTVKPNRRKELTSREKRDSLREYPRERGSRRGSRENKPREARTGASELEPKLSPVEPKKENEEQNLAEESEESKQSKWPRKAREPRERKGSRNAEFTPRGAKVATGEDLEQGPKSRIHNLSERNKSFASSNRPDFKKHLSEMTNAMEREQKNSRKSRRGGPNDTNQSANEVVTSNEGHALAISESKDQVGGEHDDQSHRRRGRGNRRSSPEKTSAPAMSNGSDNPEAEKDGDDSKNIAEMNNHLQERRGRRGGFRGRGFRGRGGRGRGRGSSSSGVPGPDEGNSQS